MIAVMMVIIEMRAVLRRLIIVIVIVVIMIVLMVKHQFRFTSHLHHLHFVRPVQKHRHRQQRTLLQRRHIREPAESGDHEAKTLQCDGHWG